MVFPGRYRKLRDTFNSELVPDGAKVSALVELDFVRDHASTIPLIIGVLQVPPCLVLLDELTDNGPVGIVSGRNIFNNAPDFEVLDRISYLVFGRSLPRNDESAEGREPELVDIVSGYGGYNVADRGVYNVNSASCQIRSS